MTVVSYVSYRLCHLNFVFHSPLSEIVPLHWALQSKLSITKKREISTVWHHEDIQVSNLLATPTHQTSNETASDTNTVLHQQNTHLQHRIAQLQQDHQQEITHLRQEITRLQHEARQLQSRLDQQPRLGSDTDISFWVVSHNEVRPTGQVLGEGGWGRVMVGSFRGQDVAMKQLHSIISSSDYYRDLLRREISLMAKVRHPNLLLFVAAVLDSPSNTPIIITELMDTNLRQAYHNAQLTNNGTKLGILKDVSAALNYLHPTAKPNHSQRCEQCQRPAASSTQQQVEREAVRLWFRQPCTAC